MVNPASHPWLVSTVEECQKDTSSPSYILITLHSYLQYVASGKAFCIGLQKICSAMVTGVHKGIQAEKAMRVEETEDGLPDIGHQLASSGLGSDVF